MHETRSDPLSRLFYPWVGHAYGHIKRKLGARLEVVNLGTVTYPGLLEDVLNLRLVVGLFLG